MINMNFRMIGTEELMKVFKNCSGAGKEVSRIITDTTADVMADSQKNLNPHYDTGQLSRSGTFKVQGLTGEVGYGVHYAPHLEYGHRTRSGGFVPGVKYLFNAVEKNRKPHIQEINELIRKLTGN